LTKDYDHPRVFRLLCESVEAVPDAGPLMERKHLRRDLLLTEEVVMVPPSWNFGGHRRVDRRSSTDAGGGQYYPVVLGSESKSQCFYERRAVSDVL
jgi:hypothetical protein